MKRKHYTEEQIAFALRQHESRTPVVQVVRKGCAALDRRWRTGQQFQVHPPSSSTDDR